MTVKELSECVHAKRKGKENRSDESEKKQLKEIEGPKLMIFEDLTSSRSALLRELKRAPPLNAHSLATAESTA